MRALASLSVALLGACSTPGWDGSVRTWGSMREVMAEGRSEGRISLSEAARSSRTVAIGALEGLRGEIVILRGQVWLAQVADGRLVCEHGLQHPELRATLLASAEVPRWRELAIVDGVDELDQFLASVAEHEGFGRVAAWPFVIEGTLLGLEAHVLNGACPFAGEVAPEHEPMRRTFERVQGRLVGFYAPDSGGELTHHGQLSHVHVVVDGAWTFVGHVDAVALAPGTVLSLPAR